MRQSTNGIRRLEAAVLPISGFCPVPAKSASLYINASERCSTCERLIRLEEEAPAPESRVHHCLAHYRSTSTQGTALYAHFTPDEETHKPSEGCPACVQRRDLENEAIEHTTDQIREFGARDLLCISHLTLVLGMLSEEEGGVFIRDQVERLNTLIQDLEDFIALHDYRYGRQPAENPDSPYRWALRFLASEPSNVAHLLPVGGSERFLASRRRDMGLRPRP